MEPFLAIVGGASEDSSALVFGTVHCPQEIFELRFEPPQSSSTAAIMDSPPHPKTAYELWQNERVTEVEIALQPVLQAQAFL